MYDYLAIYEENERLEKERLDRELRLSVALEDIGLRGGAPQW